MTESLSIASYEQIATLLSKLATNYSNLASTFYDVFYSTTPEDVQLKMFDEFGTLQTYIIPNRAKDLANMLSGEGSPEGSVAGLTGQIYQDLKNGILYIKKTADGNEGWESLSTEEYVRNILIQDRGNPEGKVEAEKGILYIDTETAILYIKTTPTGTTGWESITVSTEGYADTGLSNLTVAGRNRFANPDLSNLSYDGENHFASKFNKKEDKENKVTSINENSTNLEYPSAKATYEALQGRESVENKVTNISATSTDEEYPSAKAVYNISQSSKTLQDITILPAGSSVSVTLTNGSSVYKLTPTSSTTLSFINNTSATSDKLYTFELYLNMTGSVYSIIWPSSVRWQNNEAPDLSVAGTYFFAFRTLNGGSTWIGNLQGVW